VSALLVLLAATSAAGLPELGPRHRVGLGVYTGVLSFTADEDFGDDGQPFGGQGRSLGLRLGVRAVDDLWIEGAVGLAFADLARGDEILRPAGLTSWRVGARYELPIARLRPFVALGFSSLEVTGEDGSSIRSLEAGGGVLFELRWHFSLRVDVLARRPLEFAGVASEAQVGLFASF
jgi:hypothetical protein